jgi:hypothetical protein
MAINWGAAAQNNNPLTYFTMGQQMGQQIIDKRVNSAAARYAQGDQNALADIMKYDATRGMELQKQQVAADKLRADQERLRMEQGQKQAATFRQLLEAAKDNPQQAFSAAQQLGIPLDRVPPPNSPEFEPWRQTQLFILKATETPEGKDMLTNTAKNVMLSLPPEQRSVENPAFIAGMNKALEAEALKTIPYVQGGGVAGFNPLTGQTQNIITPNTTGAPAGSPVNATTPNEGAIAENKSTGQKLIFRNGQWQPMGGQPAGPAPFGNPASTLSGG